LALVKLMVELHGGTVAVESGVDLGSNFTVWLPVRTLRARSITPPSTQSIPQTPVPVLARTALVVDDDYKSVELIRLQLLTQNFVVVHAPSGEAALVLAARQPLALIILDILLPGMDGWQFLERIREIPALQQVPVVVVTIVPDIEKGRTLGAALMIQKPLSRDALHEALATLRLIPGARTPVMT
jgi:CheY-like chemotaxis protein